MLVASARLVKKLLFKCVNDYFLVLSVATAAMTIAANRSQNRVMSICAASIDMFSNIKSCPLLSLLLPVSMIVK